MKAFLALFTVLSVLAYSNAAVKSLGERIECMRGVQTRLYEDRIRELVEGLRDQLKNGIPDKNIPAMDPLVMDNMNLKIDESMAKLDWTMDGSINGLMSWDLTDIKFSLVGFKFNFGILFPEIAGKGTYKIDGVIAELLPIYGSGDFNVLAKNLKITGSGQLGSRGTGDEQQLYLKNFSIGVSLESFDFGVTGLMDDPELNSLLSKMISESLPDLINNLQSQIDSIVSGKVTELADGVLNNLTMQDILDMLKPKPADAYLFEIHCGDPRLRLA